VERFHEMAPTGVLYNTDVMGLTYPARNVEFRKRVIQAHGLKGIANSGLFMGSIADIIRTYTLGIEILDAYVLDNNEHPAFSWMDPFVWGDFKAYKNSATNKAVGGTLCTDDQLAVQLIQVLMPELAVGDKDKRLMAIVYGEYPDVHNRRRESHYGDTAYIGDALMMHAPFPAADPIIWPAYVREHILQGKVSREVEGSHG